MSRWTMHHGDCLEWMRTLPDKSVDHVICDPPYEAEAHTQGRRIRGKTLPGGGRQIVEAPVPFPPITAAERVAIGAEIARVVRRWALVFCQVEATHLWATALQPLAYRRTCVWVKPDGRPQYSGDRPGVGYECFVLSHPKGRCSWNGGGKVGVFTHLTLAGARAAWNAKAHPTQKPTSLMVELVSLFTDPGETILDPFAGSGTTGVAALRLGRRFLGAEKDAAHYATACARLAAEEGGSTLAAARAGQLSLLADPLADAGKVTA